MTTPAEKLAMLDYIKQQREILNRMETIVNTSTPTPPPVHTKQFEVTDVKAVIRQIAYANKSGFPVMEIYPDGDNTEPIDRLVYPKGKKVTVYPELVKGDGGHNWYEISQVFEKAKRLFVDAIDGKLV